MVEFTYVEYTKVPFPAWPEWPGGRPPVRTLAGQILYANIRRSTRSPSTVVNVDPTASVMCIERVDANYEAVTLRVNQDAVDQALEIATNYYRALDVWLAQEPPAPPYYATDEELDAFEDADENWSNLEPHHPVFGPLGWERNND